MNQPKNRWLTLLAAIIFGAASMYLWVASGQAPFATQALPTATATEALPPTPTTTEEPTSTPTLTPVPATATTEPSPTPTVASGDPDVFATLEPAEATAVAPPVDPLASPIEGKLWVGLYGAATGPGLGILGTQSPTDTITTAMNLAAEYTAILTGTDVIPFFHMVVTVADPFAGVDGDYVHRTNTETIQVWIDVGTPKGILSVVDVQPGHSTITSELEYLEPILEQKGVHLAIDPEFNMELATDIPGSVIGHMTGDQLNLAQAWLNDLALRTGERKVLIIHQFDNRMFSGKENIIDYPYVDLVWDSDGFGGPAGKIADYDQYAAEPGFEYGGFKIFYNYDVPVMTPAEVVVLEPKPVFVVYQ